VGIKYVGRLLLDTEKRCTWRQILAKVISLNNLEESFYLFLEHVKYNFAHLNPSLSLKSCFMEKFCIHIWIQHTKYTYWCSWDKKKLHLLSSVIVFRWNKVALTHQNILVPTTYDVVPSIEALGNWLR
jgi:hypothetical protein